MKRFFPIVALLLAVCSGGNQLTNRDSGSLILEGGIGLRCVADEIS